MTRAPEAKDGLMSSEDALVKWSDSTAKFLKFIDEEFCNLYML